jgi:hypothetical protein
MVYVSTVKAGALGSGFTIVKSPGRNRTYEYLGYEPSVLLLDYRAI